MTAPHIFSSLCRASEGAPADNFSAEKLAPQIGALRRSGAALAGTTEKGAPCPALHMRGLTHVISIFEVPEDHVRAVPGEFLPISRPCRCHPHCTALFLSVQLCTPSAAVRNASSRPLLCARAGARAGLGGTPGFRGALRRHRNRGAHAANRPGAGRRAARRPPRRRLGSGQGFGDCLEAADAATRGGAKRRDDDLKRPATCWRREFAPAAASSGVTSPARVACV